MNAKRLAVCALGGLLTTVGAIGVDTSTVRAECNTYRPPPPPPPPTADPNSGVPGMEPAPETGPSAPGGSTRGPATGGRRPAGGVRTGGGGGGGGIEAGHWSHWWYANRLFVIETGMRAHTHAAASPRTGRAARDLLWRADARRALAAALSDADDEVVAAAVLALGKAGDASDIGLVRSIAVDPKRGSSEREHAAMALGLLAADTPQDAAESRNALRAIAADDQNSERLRALALYAIGLRGEEAAVPFLADFAARGARSWDLPAASLSALGLSGCEAARVELGRVLVEARGRRQTLRRVYAAHGFAKLGDVAALPLLVRVLDDEEADVRRAAAMAIGKLAPPGDPEIVRALRRVLDTDRDRGARAMAAVALGLIGGDEALSALRKTYARDDAALRPFAAVAIGVIARRSDRPRIASTLR